jgi:hypothetical protein
MIFGGHMVFDNIKQKRSEEIKRVERERKLKEKESQSHEDRKIIQ